MADAIRHPSAQELSDFGLGRLPAAAAATVADHLEICPACQQAVAELPPDSFLGKVRAAQPGPASVSGSRSAPGAETAALPEGLPPELASYPKYRFLRELGRGGMGVVYLAEQTLMGRRVAVKVISPAVLAHPDALPRFQSEVKAAAQLDHPNIVRAYDAEQVGSLHLLIMEYVEGANLADLVQRKGPLSVVHACHFIRQAALGLQHAFEQGTVHRDVKPHNLMVTPKGQVKILDFGLARLRSGGRGLTEMGSFMGTPEYVSPEQAADARTADTRADLYSLGCTLYFLLTGRPPFPEDTAVKVILAQIEKEAPPVQTLRPEVPEALSAVVARLLAKDPAQRYQQPVELARALVPFIKQGSKREAVSLSSLALPVSERGTALGINTSKVLPARENPAREVPARSATAKGKPAAPHADLLTAAAPLTTHKRVRPAQAAPAAAWYRRPLVLASVGGAVLALGLGIWLLAGVIFKVQTKDGILVIGVNEPNPTVYMDGELVATTWDNAGKQAEIRARPGTHQVEVKKDGFTVYSDEVTLKAGGRQILTARLDKIPSHRPAPLAPPTAPKIPLPGRDKMPSRRPAPLDCTGPLGVSAAAVKQAQAAWAQYLVRQVEEEDEIAPGVKMTFVLVPPGRFWMGSPYNEQGRDDDEVKHEVELTQPFYLGKFEVTQAQYEAITGKNPSHFKGAKLPVEQVSWEEADAFARELTRKRGLSHLYRLPTEAEWEYACRGGRPSSQPFGVGDGRLLSSTQANIDGEYPYGVPEKGPYLRRTTPVGTYVANALGLYDMHGNVWEWCADWYGDYPSEKVTDPTGPAEGSTRVFRGGSWNNYARNCRAAYRNRYAPGIRSNFLGFRLARVPLKVPTRDGILVIGVNEPNPTVSVDGEIVAVPWDQAGQKAEVHVRPGTHQVEVKKDGFTVYTEKVTLEAGGRQVLTARLEKMAPRRPAPLDCTGSLGVSAEEVKKAQAAWAKYLGRQVEEEDEIAPGVKMTFVLVPPGRFWMGSPYNEQGRDDDEVKHEVELTQPFYLGKYEVTQAQYEAVTGQNPSHFKGAKLPVESVSWEEANAFARELSRKRGLSHLYRLPTEAEWEYACRGGHPYSHPFGIGAGRLLSSTQANYNGNYPYGGEEKGPNLGTTTPVGQYAANTLGLYDMHGNVWEWCADWYGEYPSGKVADPRGPSTGPDRVFRGGSWFAFGSGCRAANRRRLTPTDRSDDLGFRLARVPSGMGK